ncbi:MAG: hypothetical protein IBX45_13090 [Campylobacterales bacterium]|nr:hypothetical protein [Campylobacterales bacterium]
MRGEFSVFCLISKLGMPTQYQLAIKEPQPLFFASAKYAATIAPQPRIIISKIALFIFFQPNLQAWFFQA